MKTIKNISIGRRIMDNSDFFRQLSVPNRKQQHHSYIIQQASADQLLATVEACFNMLKARVPLTNAQRKALLKNARAIRTLSRVRTHEAARRILLRSQRQRPTQQGRGLPAMALAGLVSSILFPLINQYIDKK